MLRGELSFIGPRPDDLFAVDLYRGTDWLKLSITPGITGLAQISGRNDLPYRERLKYDVYYALRRDLWLDLRILARTIAVAAGADASKQLVSVDEIERVASSPEAIALAAELERAVRSND